MPVGVFVLMLVALLCVPSKFYSQDPRIARFDSLMEVLVQRTDFSGTVLVAEDGKPIYHKAFGMANREWNVAQTTNSRYKLASLGKQFTALLILQMAEEKRIRLDDPLIKYLPEYKIPGAEKILIRHVLSHRSGIPNYHVIPLFDSVVNKRHYTLDQFVQLFVDKPLLFEPGTDFQYSNLGYSALALEAQRVSGTPFNTLLRRKIFEPAGMSDTYPEDEMRVMPNTASGYQNTFTGYERERFRDPSSVTGSGHLVSTTSDLLRYDQALRSGRLLSLEMQKVWMTMVGNNYGMGWMLTRTPVPGKDSLTIAYHDGGNSGFTTVMYRYLESNACIVVLSNTAHYNIYGVSARLSRVLLGREIMPVKKQLVSEYARILEKNGSRAAAAFFREHRSAPDYELDGGALNVFGYHLLRNGRINDAVSVFELNVEAFPQEANAFDSLAEGYMSQGRQKEAIANYQRSLSLDPNNSNARVMLQRLTLK